MRVDLKSGGARVRKNAPTFAYEAVYGQPKWMMGRTDEETQVVDGIPVDKSLKPEWIRKLNSIPGVEGRSSCGGHEGPRVPYFIFRLDEDEKADEVAKNLKNMGLYSKSEIGAAGRPRIVVAADLEQGTPEWEEWWSKLPERIQEAVKKPLRVKVGQASPEPSGEVSVLPEKGKHPGLPAQGPWPKRIRRPETWGQIEYPVPIVRQLKEVMQRRQDRLPLKTLRDRRSISPLQFLRSVYGSRTQEVVDKAKKYMSDLPGREKGEPARPDFSKLNKQFPVGYDDLGGARGAAYKGRAWLNPALDFELTEDSELPEGAWTLGHELSHLMDKERQGFLGIGSGPSRFELMEGIPESGEISKGLGTKYFLNPTEVTARMANIKRKLFAEDEQLVNTPEKARKALEWAREEGSWPGLFTYLDRLQKQNPKTYKKLLESMIKTMPGLVRREQATKPASADEHAPKSSVENSLSVRLYNPKQDPAEDLDELDEIVLNAVKKHLKPLSSPEMEPQATDQSAEDYWAEYAKDHPIFIGKDPENGLAGQLTINPDPGWDDAFGISSISVRPEWRGRGLAEKLLSEAIRWGRAKGLSYAMYNTQDRNKASRGFAEAHGFEPYGIQYYKELEKEALDEKAVVEEQAEDAGEHKTTGISVMPFPESELSAYKDRLGKGLPTYTTRVSAERGKYSPGDIVESPLGRLMVTEVREFDNIDSHPFKAELTEEQRQQISGPFDVVRVRILKSQAKGGSKSAGVSVRIGRDPELFDASAEEDFTPEQIAGHNYYTAHRDGDQVGFALTIPALKGDSRWIRSLYTRPEYRRQGVAKELIDTIRENEEDLFIQPQPFKDQPLSAEELADIYERMGFKRIEDPRGEGRVLLKSSGAPGIPEKGEKGDLSRLQEVVGELTPWVLQRHIADRAGEHLDLRLRGPEGLYSWAVPKGKLPEPGQPRKGIQVELHSPEYREFEGEIEEGYGKGKVEKAREGQVIITKVEGDPPSEISFTVAGRDPERFKLKKTDEDWLIINTTPTRAPDHEKRHFESIDPEDSEKLEEMLGEVSSDRPAEVKIDGALGLLKLMKDKADIVSYRTSKRTGGSIVHTERVDPSLLDLDVPEELVGKTLEGEIFAQRDGETLSSQEIGGLLNSTIARSRQKQKDEGISFRMALFDVLPRDLSKEQKDRLVDMAVQLSPTFTRPPKAEQPEAARELLESVRGGEHPLSEEGLVFRGTRTPVKYKPVEESDVIVEEIFPGKGRLEGEAAGGFQYRLTPEGEPVGRVGTGFTDQMRRELWENAQDYVDRVARIRAQQQFPSGAFRAPVFVSFHEDYPRESNGTEWGSEIESRMEQT